ncbi:hypothetical protein ACIBSR_25310 [Streptomyces sp. NPDC049936]|uniref:hypothetical protein n=1 Tax=Streptomyces sp. NPDC049936 TaxID=3365599 RepID=UPI0037A8DF36
MTAQLGSGERLAIVCHAPAAMPATRVHGVSPFEGYEVTGCTNEEEEGVGLALVEDRSLVTGQNPASAEVPAGRLLKVLG